MLGESVGEVKLRQGIDQPVIPVGEISSAKKNGLVDRHLLAASGVDDDVLAVGPDNPVSPVAQPPRPLHPPRRKHDRLAGDEEGKVAVIGHPGIVKDAPGDGGEALGLRGDRRLAKNLRAGHDRVRGLKKHSRFDGPDTGRDHDVRPAETPWHHPAGGRVVKGPVHQGVESADKPAHSIRD